MRIIITIVLGLAFALLVGVGSYWQGSECLLCDGCYTLQVEVDSAKRNAIEAMLCEPFGTTEQAQEQLDFIVNSNVQMSKPIFGELERPFEATSIKLLIPFSERVYSFGRRVENYSFRMLLVIAQYRGADRVGKILDISKCRDGDKVTVKLL